MQRHILALVCYLVTIIAYFDQLPAGRRTLMTAGMQQQTEARRPVFVGGFFPIEMHPYFASLPSTAQAAVDHVNNLTGILDGYELRLRWNWTQGSSANALRILNDFVQAGPPVAMTWGPMFSSVAVVVNEVLPRYDIVQIVIASSATLKDRSRYPLTVQISVDEDLLNPARVAFVKRMGWRRVALIFEDNEYFRQNMAKLSELLVQSNITVLATEAVPDTQYPDKQIESLKRHDARVIITGFYPEPAAKLFCKIFKAKLYGAKYVWILPGWYPDGWWADLPDVTCTNDQLSTALDLYLSFDGDQAVRDVSEIDFHGVKPYPEQLEYLKDLHTMDDNSRVIYTYDCLFAMALALNASIAELQQLEPPRGLDEFSYGDSEMAKVLLRNTLRTEFVGLTGRVIIGKEGVRHTTVYVEQFQGGYPARIGNFFVDGSYDAITNATIQWRGSRKPVDGKTELPRPVRVSIPYQISVFTAAGFGVLLALVFLGLNIALRNQRAIKISSPQINNVIILGCLVLYSSVFISGMDTTSFSDKTLISICYVKVGLICVGMSMSFGSLLVKTYRIFAIFQRAVAKFKKIDLPDTKLMSVVGLLVLVDIIILTLWIILARSTVETYQFEPELAESFSTDSEVYIVAELRQCVSINDVYFRAVIYGFKGILLVFGIFLSWEIRNVQVKGLNDSKYIALSVYTVGVTIVLAVPALQVVARNVDMYFCIFGVSTIFANTVVLCLVFVPKFALCYSTRGSHLHISMMDTPSTSSTGTGFKSHASSGNKERSRAIRTLQRTLEEKTSELNDLLVRYQA